MSRVGLARCAAGYAGLAPPWAPEGPPPELASLLGSAGGPPNPVHGAVRAALAALGLDGARFGTEAWNPLGGLVAPGGHVVLKPNFIRHWNPAEHGSTESLVTHGSVLRAVADYALLAVGPQGRVTVAEAPQHDCDFDAAKRLAGLDEVAADYARCGRRLEVVDLRREAVRYRDGVIVERRELPGDPKGYRLVDLGERSLFHGSGLDPRRFRGADYDVQPTTQHHTGGRHEYLLSETVLSADLVVNLPKLKTHKKTGVTLCLKNLVGINGDKNLLPHHCAGPAASGGDEYPEDRLVDRGRTAVTDLVRQLLKRGLGTGLVRRARRLEQALRGDEFVRSGNWYGNRTTWRMVLDLNRCLYYSDAAGAHLDAEAPVRRVLHVLDGVVAGEGEGPLAPTDRPLGAVLASLDPVALDLAAVRLMGFDEAALPVVREAMASAKMPIGAITRPEDAEVFEASADGDRRLALEALEPEQPFLAHSGWKGHVEKTRCAA